MVFPGFWCIERDWNLYSWGRSQTAGTDSAKAPLGLACLRRVPATALANPQQQQSKDARREERYVPISGITHIHNTVYHLPFLQEAAYTGYAGLPLRLTQNKATSAFIITKLSRLRDGTQEQLLAMHLRGDTSTRRGRNRTCGSNRYMRACAHTIAHTITHTDKRAQEHTGLDTLSSHPPADRQMARVTLSHWHGGAYNLKPCLHLKIHQYHIDVQYTSCQRGPLSFAMGPGCCSICMGRARGEKEKKKPLPHKKVILLHIMNVASAQSEGQPSFVYNGQESTVFQMRRMQNRLPSKYWNHLWAVCVINSPHKSGAAQRSAAVVLFWCSLTLAVVYYCTAASRVL